MRFLCGPCTCTDVILFRDAEHAVQWAFALRDGDVAIRSHVTVWFNYLTQMTTNPASLR